MHLPVEIREKTESLAQRIPRAALARAVERLSAHYRDRQATSRLPLSSEELVAAYLVSRFPATYAAARQVFQEFAPRAAAPPASLLDLGAGCGAATLAACSVFPIASSTLIEAHSGMIGAGKELLPQATWHSGRLGETAFPTADLVVASYVFGELNEKDRDAVVERAWKAAQVLVVIEPGSTAGFQTVLSIRHRLLAQDAHMLAPCPHAGPCPLPASDWCHFAARLERSSLHRQLKQAALNYEDEKFSYVVLAKAPATLPPARIVRRPTHQPGLIELMVCRGATVAPEPVRRRDKDKFRAARHASWGDAWQ